MDFFEKYDHKGDMSFSNVSYRKGAKFTLDFGIYTKKDIEGFTSFKEEQLSFKDNRTIYIHCGVDRGGYKSNGSKTQQIINPFDCKGEWHEKVNGYGTLLLLYPLDTDFIIRIAHIEKLNPVVLDKIKMGYVIKANEFIGNIGRAGTGTGPHTHTEVVSITPTSLDCERILMEKDLWSNHNLKNELLGNVNDKYLHDLYKHEFSIRGIVNFNNHWCQRNNGFGKPDLITYYDSTVLFGM